MIRGCYRRRTRGATVIEDDDVERDGDVDAEDEVASGLESDGLDNNSVASPTKKRGRPPKTSKDLQVRSPRSSPSKRVPAVAGTQNIAGSAKGTISKRARRQKVWVL